MAFIVRLIFQKRITWKVTIGVLKFAVEQSRKAEVMKLKLQKRSALKFVSRIIPHKQVFIPRLLGQN